MDEADQQIIIMGGLNGSIGEENDGMEWCLAKQGENTSTVNG